MVRAMNTVYEAMEAFLGAHRRCGELDGGVEGGRLWAACSCGASLAQPLSAEEGPVAESA